MMAWILRLVVLFAVLTAVYIALSWYMRWVRRQELEAQYGSERPEEPRPQFIARGLRDYDRSLRPRLVVGVYLVPVIFVIVLVALASYT